MNQVTNLIQWKNHTDEQKADFDFENYKYYWQTSSGVFLSCDKSDFSLSANVYRLVIEDDKWYVMVEYDGMKVYKDMLKGSAIRSPEKYTNLRPAKPDEIPQPEKTLEQKIQDKWPDKEVVMLTPENGVLRIVKKIGGFEYDRPHIFAQSMKGFHKYVYELLSGKLELNTRPIMPGVLPTLQPVAVLFER